VQIAILGVGAYLVLLMELSSGASIAGSIIMGRALAPVEQMIGGWKQLVQARQSFRRLAGLPGPAPAAPARPAAARADRPPRVERVSYAFPGQGVAMIKGVNFASSPARAWR
jgi:ATP-binding cassette subfamily C protein/ATP-binding cassette subfamily C protein EexD